MKNGRMMFPAVRHVADAVGGKIGETVIGPAIGTGAGAPRERSEKPSRAGGLIGLPDWFPDAARFYLRHVEQGQSLRQIARSEGCHASTVLRHVRRLEQRRDDPLVDEALEEVLLHPRSFGTRSAAGRLSDEAAIRREALRILRRLCESDAILAVAPEMPRAVVLRGELRLAVTGREMARAFALKDWIAVERRQGRVTLYEITGTGRSALRQLLLAGGGDDESGGVPGWPAGWNGEGRSPRLVPAESPLAMLARRRNRDGSPFLSADLVAVAERLREDFELAQLGLRRHQNWERFLMAEEERGQVAPEAAGPPATAEQTAEQATGLAGPALAARTRVAAALRDLGPGLGDMVLRVCCFLEGIETAEQHLGWSARSGKIVLRIALVRLRRHYGECYGTGQPLLG